MSFSQAHLCSLSVEAGRRRRGGLVGVFTFRMEIGRQQTVWSLETQMLSLQTWWQTLLSKDRTISRGSSLPSLSSLYFRIEEEDETVPTRLGKEGSWQQKTLVDGLQTMTTFHKRACACHVTKGTKSRTQL